MLSEELRIHGVANASVHAPLRAANNQDKPKRSVFIYLPNGVNTDDYEIIRQDLNMNSLHLLRCKVTVLISPQYLDLTILTLLASHTKQLTLGLQVQNMGRQTAIPYQLTN